MTHIITLHIAQRPKPLTPSEQSCSHRKRQHQSLSSRRRHNPAVVLLGGCTVPQLAHHLRRDLPRLSELVELGRHRGQDRRRPTRRAEDDLEPPARWNDECGRLIIKCYTTVNTRTSPPIVPCHPPKLYASGHTFLAS